MNRALSRPGRNREGATALGPARPRSARRRSTARWCAGVLALVAVSLASANPFAPLAPTAPPPPPAADPPPAAAALKAPAAPPPTSSAPRTPADPPRAELVAPPGRALAPLAARGVPLGTEVAPLARPAVAARPTPEPAWGSAALDASAQEPPPEPPSDASAETLPVATEPSQQRLYPLRHAGADTLAATLEQLLADAPSLRITAIAGAELLAITTTPSAHTRVEEWIALLDQPSARVAVHLMMVEVETHQQQSRGTQGALPLGPSLRLEVDSGGSLSLAFGGGEGATGALNLRALERSGAVSRVEEVTLILQAGVRSELFFGGQYSERPTTEAGTPLTIPYGLQVSLLLDARSLPGDVLLMVELTLDELLSRQELHRSRRTLSSQARLGAGETVLLAEVQGSHRQAQQSSPLGLAVGSASGRHESELRERTWLLFASATPLDGGLPLSTRPKLAWDVLD